MVGRRQRTLPQFVHNSHTSSLASPPSPAQPSSFGPHPSSFSRSSFLPHPSTLLLPPSLLVEMQFSSSKFALNHSRGGRTSAVLPPSPSSCPYEYKTGRFTGS